jgi:hypothetical protein
VASPPFVPVFSLPQAYSAQSSDYIVTVAPLVEGFVEHEVVVVLAIVEKYVPEPVHPTLYTVVFDLEIVHS